MKNPFRIVKRIALVALLTSSITSLALISEGAPASHAAYLLALPPRISATDTSINTIRVTGTGFTQGGSVWVGVYDDYGNFVASVQTTARRFCVPPLNVICSPPGEISVVIGIPVPACASFTRYDKALAYDWSSHTYSNVATVYVQCLT
jgi:hypothetical protein